MTESSDNDDLPDLVDSSDEDSPAEKKAKKTNADLASSWLSKSSKFLEKQELWMRIFSLCPFLYGINNIVSAAWVKALHTAKLLLNEKRQYEVTYLEWQEWECLDLMDHIIPIVQDKMRKKDVLCRCLDCVEVLEECKKGVIIDVDQAIQAANKYEDVSDLWTDVLKDQVCNGKEMAARFGVLYVIKLYQCHVISIEVYGKDFIEEKKKEYKTSSSVKKAEEFKKKGNGFYSTAKYQESIEFYTQAIKVDPFHHIYFGNRAQAYNKLKEYKEALADGRRAITIKPDFSKGHYRYGQAFYELGQLEAAIRVNKIGLQLCEKSRSTDYMNVKDLEEQGEKFWQARREGANTGQPLTSIPKDLAKKLLNSIGFDENGQDLNTKFGVGEPPLLVSSDSDSDSSPPPAEERIKKKNKSKTLKLEKEKSGKSRRERTISEKTEKVEEKKPSIDLNETIKEIHLKNKLKTQKQEKEKSEKVEEKRPSLDLNEILLKRADIGPDNITGRSQLKHVVDPAVEVPVGLQLHLSKDDQINKLMADASEALLKNVNKVAISNYKKALDMIASTDDLEVFGMDETDVLTLKYAYGMAAVSTGIYKNILEGMEKFKEILDVNMRYPMAYYGLGKAYITLNRFVLALQKLQEGHNVVVKIDKGLGINRNCEYWPGTKTVIEESDLKCLKVLLEDLIQLCHFPPAPDAVCRHHSDRADTRTDIYRSDPDFKGLYQIVCELGCIVSFHPNCWKDYKTERNTTVDKDILDTVCITPDCSGLIRKIIIERDLDTKKEIVSEEHTTRAKQTREKKPVVKMKSTSDLKLAKKKDKKDLRKQRRRERLEEKDDLAEENHEKPQHLQHTYGPEMMGHDIGEGDAVYDGANEVHSLPAETEAVVLKREKEKILVPKAPSKHKKNKKKKDKAKQLLTLEVNFSDRKEETLLGENSVVSDEEEEKNKKSKPANTGPGLLSTPKFPTPQLGKKPAENVKTIPDQKTDDITENLLSYFADILKVHGPLEIDDIRIRQEIEVFPIEAQEKIKIAGGLGDFLRQDLRFAVIDDVISLMTDAVKARDIALTLRNERVSQGKQPLVQDAWKTVGKEKDIDSLKESVTDSSLNTERTSYVSALSNHPPYSAVVQSKDISHSTPSSDSHAVLVTSSANSNTSNSVSSLLYGKASLKETENSVGSILENHSGFTVDALDSIDDFPLPRSSSYHEVKSNSKLDDLDDFDIYPDSASSISDKGSEKSRKGRKNQVPRLPRNAIASQNSVSDSASDISEASDISVECPKPAVGGMPKPLKPINRFEPPFAQTVKKESGSDFRDNHPVTSLDIEMKRLAEDFIRKTDEELMSEIADSVVEKIYSGKSVSDMERANTLKQVSDDIRKDFEKSAKSGGLWANTPASGDYSKNIGKFASDFMKSHYRKENIVFSPTSDPSLLNFQKPPSDDCNLLNSPQNMTILTGIEPNNTFSSSVIPSSFSIDYTSGYNLFSGPSIGLDSLSSPRSPVPQFPRSPHPVVLPPPSAATYYSNIPPPSAKMSLQQPPPLTPLKIPSFHAVLKIDKETQVISAVYASVETMTDSYDVVDLELYLRVKDDYERMMRETTRFKDKFVAEIDKLEGRAKNQHNEITALNKKLESERKAWSKEKESFQEVIKNLREQLANKQKSEAELKQKLLSEENRLAEQTKQIQEQREKDLEEMKRVLEEVELSKIFSQRQCERAKAAEIEILKSKLAGATKMLERSRKEAAFHVKNLEALTKKHEENSKPVPAPLRQSVDYWKTVAQRSEETLAKVKTDYEAQMLEISSGKQISELPDISIPSPPPIPDSIKSFMMPNHNNIALPHSSLMPRQPQAFGPRPPVPNTMAQGNTRFPTPVTMAIQRPEYNLSTAMTGNSVSGLQQLSAPLQPLSGARPIRPPSSGMTTAGPQGTKTSFEKLILKLQIDFPNHNKNDFNQFIQALRQKRGGSLSGMSMQDIITQVSNMISQQDRLKSKKAQGAETLEKPVAPPPGISASWAFPTSSINNNSSGGGLEMYQEGEDPCAICHEELTLGSTQILECTHKFHDECIRKWFREQSTCPNCRVHSLLSDEFPTLG